MSAFEYGFVFGLWVSVILLILWSAIAYHRINKRLSDLENE